MPPEYQTTESQRISLPRLIVLVVLLVGLGLLTWLVFFHHPNSPTVATNKPPHNAAQSSGSGHGSSASSTSTPAQSSGQSSSTPSSSGSSTPSSQPNAGSSNPSGNSGNQTSSLTNTGPGDTIALFVGVTVLGMLARLSYIRRRLLDS